MYEDIPTENHLRLGQSYSNDIKLLSEEFESKQSVPSEDKVLLKLIEIPF
jgi:hypothetical protein